MLLTKISGPKEYSNPMKSLCEVVQQPSSLAMYAWRQRAHLLLSLGAQFVQHDAAQTGIFKNKPIQINKECQVFKQ